MIRQLTIDQRFLAEFTLSKAEWLEMTKPCNNEKGSSMPIYEYRCRQCKKKFENLHLRTGNAETVCCPHCQGQDLDRLISRVRVIKSEESRLESLADPSKLSGIDEKDPRSIARWVKKMGQEMGDDLGMDIDQAVEESMAEQEGSGSGDAE